MRQRVAFLVKSLGDDELLNVIVVDNNPLARQHAKQHCCEIYGAPKGSARAATESFDDLDLVLDRTVCDDLNAEMPDLSSLMSR